MTLSDDEIITAFDRLLDTATTEQRPRVEAWLRAKLGMAQAATFVGVPDRRGTLWDGTRLEGRREDIRRALLGLGKTEDRNAQTMNPDFWPPSPGVFG